MAWLSRWKRTCYQSRALQQHSVARRKAADIRSIQGAVSVQADFGRVEDIVFGDNEMELRTVEGQSVIVPVNYSLFLGKN